MSQGNGKGEQEWREGHPTILEVGKASWRKWYPGRLWKCCCCYSVTKSHPALCNPMDYSPPGSSVLHYLPKFAQTHVYWVSGAIQPSHPLSTPSLLAFHLSQHQSLFQMNWHFPSSGQSTGASASATVLQTNIQGWFSLGWTGLISLQFKGLSRVFSSTTVRKRQFFSDQLSLWSSSHIHT